MQGRILYISFCASIRPPSPPVPVYLTSSTILSLYLSPLCKPLPCNVSIKKVSYIDVRPNTPCSLAGWYVTTLEAKAFGTGRLWYRTDCFVRSCLFSCTAAIQCLSYKWGAAGWGNSTYMLMFDWRALTTPQKATLDSMNKFS
jgi:hypothetical protein